MRLRHSVWRPSLEVFKYQNKKSIKSSNFLKLKEDALLKLNSGNWNDVRWLKSIKRKIGSFMLHKTYLHDNRVYSLHKRVKFSYFKKYLGLNETNRIVGYTPDYVGVTVSKIISSKNYVVEFLTENFEELKKNVSSFCFRDLVKSANEERVVFSAGITSSFKHLKEFLKDDTSELTIKEIFKILSLQNFKWFPSAKVSFDDGNELFVAVKSNLNAFSGHYTSMIFGREKHSSDFASRKIAFNIWSLLKTDPVKNRFLWSILGREKDIKWERNVSKEVGTRVVLTCEAPMTILLCWFAQRISNIVANDFAWDCKFNISGNFDSTKYRKLLNKADKYDFVLEADWSNYDANIDKVFLIAAGLLICSGFPDNRHHRNIRYLIISSIVTKYVVLPPGVVVELNRGQPSGHPFGTLVNCYVNLIYWSIIGHKIYGDDYANNMDIEVYGDDTRAYFKNHPNLININQYVKECGLKSDDLLPNMRSVNEFPDKDKDIDFLKRRFDYEGIRWNHKKMFDKLLYQSKNRDVTDQFLMVRSWYDSVPTDIDAKNIYIMFSKFLKNKYFDSLDNNSKKDINELLCSPDKFPKIYDSFTLNSVNDDIIKNHNSDIARLCKTIIIRKESSVNIYDKFGIYADNVKMLAITGNVPYKGIKKKLIQIGVLGRDPPDIDYSDDLYKKFELFKKSSFKSFMQQIIKFSNLVE